MLCGRRSVPSSLIVYRYIVVYYINCCLMNFILIHALTSILLVCVMCVFVRLWLRFCVFDWTYSSDFQVWYSTRSEYSHDSSQTFVYKYYDFDDFFFILWLNFTAAQLQEEHTCPDDLQPCSDIFHCSLCSGHHAAQVAKWGNFFNFWLFFLQRCGVKYIYLYHVDLFYLFVSLQLHTISY